MVWRRLVREPGTLCVIGVSAYRRIGLWACRATESATHLQACVFPNRLPVSLMPHSSSTNAGLFSSGSPPSNSQ